MDILADPELRLRALVALLAVVAGIRLILTGLLQPARRWSLVVGGILVSFGLARELPGFLPPTTFHAAPTAHSTPPTTRGHDNPGVLARLRVAPAADPDAVLAPRSDDARGDQ
jgi:hypothetical protein